MKHRHTIRDLQQSLAHAEEQARKSDQRWTQTRRQVYEALLTSGVPLTAYQVMEAVKRANARAMQPASVYRSLQALMALGVVAKIESRNLFVACRHAHHEHQHVFLVCDSCGGVDEIADHGISGRLASDAASKGFRALRQVLELHGACGACKA